MTSVFKRGVDWLDGGVRGIDGGVFRGVSDGVDGVEDSVVRGVDDGVVGGVGFQAGRGVHLSELSGEASSR